MRQEERDKIKGYYDRTGEWKVNKRYSQSHMTVYTKDGDKYHWLVVEEGIRGIEVHRTDEHGNIITRDYYQSVSNRIFCTGMERNRANGIGIVMFTANEINLIYQFGGKNREETINSLKSIILKITDNVEKEMITTIMNKLSVLSEANSTELMITIRNYKSFCEEKNSKSKQEAIREKRRKQPKRLEINREKYH